MPIRNPTGWMWAEACELMARAERMQRQFFRLSEPNHGTPVWEPPVDVFEDERLVVVVVALPGVIAQHIDVQVEEHGVVVRARRQMPAASRGRRVHRLEIPYGVFERRVTLPETRVEAAGYEVADGCLVVRLRKV
jgi:HSP20 family molecular chaperone IbpA